MAADSFDKAPKDEQAVDGDSGRKLAAELEAGMETKSAAATSLYEKTQQAAQELAPLVEARSRQVWQEDGYEGEPPAEKQGRIYFSPDLGRQDVKIDEIDQVVLDSLTVDETGGMMSISVDAFSDGSPFTYEADLDKRGWSVAYDVVLSPDRPPFIAPIDHYQPGGFRFGEPAGEKPDATRRTAQTVKVFFDAVERGEHPEPYYLTDDECASVEALLTNPALRSTDSIKTPSEVL